MTKAPTPTKTSKGKVTTQITPQKSSDYYASGNGLEYMLNTKHLMRSNNIIVKSIRLK